MQPRVLERNAHGLRSCGWARHGLCFVGDSILITPHLAKETMTMRAANKPFLSLTAADLMTDAVVTVGQHLSLANVAQLLAEHAISGAPVVDEAGRCVGVISATDFISFARSAGHARKERREHVPPVHSAWQVVDVQAVPREEVRDYMTKDPVMVTPDTPIAELARQMTDAHIHRVIVVDSQDRPVGVVSTTDLLAALAYAGPGAPDGSGSWMPAPVRPSAFSRTSPRQ